MVIGHWSLVIGHRSLVIGHWSSDIGHRASVIGHWSLVIGQAQRSPSNQELKLLQQRQILP